MILHKVIGAWEIHYYERASDARSKADQLAAQDGEKAVVYEMTVKIDPNPVYVAS